MASINDSWFVFRDMLFGFSKSIFPVDEINHELNRSTFLWEKFKKEI